MPPYRHPTRARALLALLLLALTLAACGSGAPPPIIVVPTSVGTGTGTGTAAQATATRAATPTTLPAMPGTATRASVIASSTRPGPPGTPSTPGTPRAATPGGTPVALVIPTPVLPTPTVPAPTPTVGPAPTVPGPPAPVPPVVVGVPTPAQNARATRAVSATNPLRIYVAGDSFAEWLGADITAFGQRSGVVSTGTDGKISSGLANPAFFDWPSRLTAAMATQPPPDVVVVILGANDLHGLPVGGIGTPAWNAEYGRRQGEIMDIVGKRGAQLYWVSQPNMRDPGQAAAAAAINVSAQTQILSRPWVHYVDSWALFSNPNGTYAGALPDINGRQVAVRQDDGLHLTREGTTWLATATYTQIRRDWQLP